MLIKPLSVTTSILFNPLSLINLGSLKIAPSPSNKVGSDQFIKHIANFKTFWQMR